jgi:protein-disulfide isomerase
VALASVAAVAGVLLLAAQAMLGHFCAYCSVVDASAIGCAVASWWRFARAANTAPPRAFAYAGAGSLVLAILVPVGVGKYLGSLTPPTPTVIRAEMARTPAGKATVVDFVDFECPFCRMTNAAFEPLLAAHEDRVRCVRRQVPLTVHPHALDAARAASCGDVLGKGDAIARALFAAPVEELTPAGCEKLAQSVGLALGPYRACVADPKTDARIEADRAEFKAAGGYALPTIWIDEVQLVGAQPAEALASTLQNAIARH